MTKPLMMADFFSFVGYRIHDETIVYLPIHEWLIVMAKIGKYMTHGSYGYGTYIIYNIQDG